MIRESHTGINIDMPDMKHVPNDPPRGEGVPPLPETVHPFGVENVHFSDINLECRNAPIRVRFRRHQGQPHPQPDLFKHDDPLTGVSVHAAPGR